MSLEDKILGPILERCHSDQLLKPIVSQIEQDPKFLAIIEQMYVYWMTSQSQNMTNTELEFGKLEILINEYPLMSEMFYGHQLWMAFIAHVRGVEPTYSRANVSLTH